MTRSQLFLCLLFTLAISAFSNVCVEFLTDQNYWRASRTVFDQTLFALTTVWLSRFWA